MTSHFFFNKQFTLKFCRNIINYAFVSNNKQMFYDFSSVKEYIQSDFLTSGATLFV